MIHKFLTGSTDINKNILLLEKIQKKWIPEIINSKLKKYKLCKQCHKYSLQKDFKKEITKEIRRETTYTDAGYGDDDRIGDVEYMVTYSICPLCQKKSQEDKMFMRLLGEKRRRDY